MKDGWGRRIDYLRLSLTDLCNFRCIYCMPPEGIVKLPRESMLRFEEIVEIVRVMTGRLGIRKVRLTGGEPLIRRDIETLVRGLASIDGIEDLAMTTNGYFLASKAEGLRRAGLQRVNVSLDTLDRRRFERITRIDGLPAVLQGLAAARKAHLEPVRINAVSMEETLDEAADLVAFGLEHGYEVRFIELMPTGAGPGGHYVPNARVIEAVSKRFSLTPLGPDGPSAARYYAIGDTGARCGFISPVSHPFCSTCNRLRLRGDGRVFPCLADSASYDLMPYVRPRFDADGLETFLRWIVRSRKKASGRADVLRSMYALGG